jgi:predicted dinucleotide-binding enzyme
LKKQVDAPAQLEVAAHYVRQERSKCKKIARVVNSRRVVACFKNPPLEEVVIVLEMDALMTLQNIDERHIEKAADIVI